MLLFSFLLLFTQNTYAGHFTGNGGDSYASDFRYWEGNLLTYLSKQKELPFELTEMKALTEKTKISSENELKLNGQSVDAINIPDSLEPQIIINRTSWYELSLYEKLRLIYHEYLGLLGIDDSRYQISNQLTPSSYR